MVMKLEKTTEIITGIGALHVGLVEFMNFNVAEVVSTNIPIINQIPFVEQTIYALVGISGLVFLARKFKWLKK